MKKKQLLALAALALPFFASGSATANTGVCKAHSAAVAPTVLELYTSEGCSSCPPADRWLSTFKGRKDILALAFHVTYWDRLGWPDRFALPEGTARQHSLAAARGSRQVYTPQVVANGRDWPDWHRDVAWPRLAAAPVNLSLQRDGSRVTARISPAAGGGESGGKRGGEDGRQFSGYWAVLEDQHQSQVRAGENAGATLNHDHVVRQYVPVSAWPSRQGGEFSLDVGSGSPDYPRRVVFVVTDAKRVRPVQAVALAC